MQTRHIAAWLRNPFNLLLLLLSLIPMYFVLLYMASYGRNVPFADQWHYDSDIAVATKNGSLSVDHILERYNDHRMLFTNLTTVIATYLTDWNLRSLMYVNFGVVLLYFLLLLVLFAREASQVFPIGMLALSALVFSLNQQYNWLVSLQSAWHFVILFLVAALVLLRTSRVGWRPVLGGAVLALCATFSFGSGVICWLLIPLAMWMLGYRKPAYFGVWLGAMGLGLVLYTTSAFGYEDAGTAQPLSLERIQWQNPVQLLLFVFGLLGNSVTYFDLTAARVMGFLGLLLFAANVVYLWLPQRDWSRVAVWLALAGYGAGAGVIIALGRFDPDQPEFALTNRFAASSLVFWFALAAVMIIVLSQLWKAQVGRWERFLFYTNLIFAVLLVGAYLRASAFTLQIAQEPQRYNHRLGMEPPLNAEEACVLNYPLTRDFSCFEQVVGWLDGSNVDEQVYRLAAYRLSTFAGREQKWVLPDTYQAGSPIIIDSPSRWLNVYIRDWMLRSVEDRVLFHIAPPEKFLRVSDLQHPLTEPIAGELNDETLAQVREFVEGMEQVWYIFTPETADHEAVLTAFLTEAGYYPTVVPFAFPLATDPLTNGNFTILRYQRQPDDLRPLYRFGEGITLQAWSMSGEAAACQTLTVGSWWLAEAAPNFNYSATLALVNTSGEVVARTDGQLADIPMQLWEVNRLFFDERRLNLPCDLPNGSYTLQFGIYNYETLEDLPLADGLGRRASLTEITVR